MTQLIPYCSEDKVKASVWRQSSRQALVSQIAAVLLILGLASAYPPRAFGDSTGEQSPTATDSGFANGSNALACDGTTADATANNQTQKFSMYGLSVPNDAIITGIQVRVRANDGTKNNRRIQVSLSSDGGASFTAPLNTSNFRRNTPLRDYLVGGSAVLWGRAWTPADITDGNFVLRALGRLPGPNPQNDAIHLDCIPVTVFYRIPGAPNVGVEKIDSPDPVQPEAPLTYAITYGNTGESTATNTVITDAVPVNTTFISASPPPVSAPPVGGTGTVTWNVGSVAFGATGLVSLVVEVDGNLGNGTVISNDTYSIASDQNTATLGNPVVTIVQGTIALSLSKTATPDPVAPGGTLTYVLTIHNGGNALSTNLVVNEAYSANVAYESFTSTCTGITGAVDQWMISSLAAGASCTITITTTVLSPLADGVLLLNQADVIDDDGSEAQAAVITTVRNPAVCGDGIITTPEEECDEVGANGTSTSCCTAACLWRDAGQVCRPAEDECDVAESCDGASATCGTDAFADAGIGCADDSNGCTDDQCDGAGNCLHSNNTAACDDLIFCNGNDTCIGGSCSGHSGDPCITGRPECDNECNEPAGNCLVAAGVPCTDDGNECTDDRCDGDGACGHPGNSLTCDDGNPCTIDDVCGGSTCQGTSVECGDGTLQELCAEQCDDGNTTAGDGCSEACALEPCGPEPEPATSCRQPALGQKAFLQLRNNLLDERDGLLWKWIKGSATQKGDFGTPLVDSDYQFCIYRGSAPRLVLSASAPAGELCDDRPCWSENRAGFRYADRDLTPNGLMRMSLREGIQEKAKIVLKGKGSNLAMPGLMALDSPVTVQLMDLKTGSCWQATYSEPFLRHDATQFKDKAD